MSLLLNTDIETRTCENIRGSVARAGGTVDQLFSYRDCSVQDINILDGGFGVLGKLSSRRSSLLSLSLLKRLKQDLGYLVKGPMVPRDHKTIILDMHEAYLNEELKHRFDAAISSNLLEHSPNPVFLLLNFYFITKEGGYQFHALPHGKYTYDRFREPTPVEHLIEDFERNTGKDDTSHVDDYVQSAIEKDGWQKSFHERYPLTYPFIHFHVFHETNTRQLMEFMFEDVVVDVLRNEKFSDNIVLFRNTLNREFLARYGEVVDRYSAAFLSGKVGSR